LEKNREKIKTFNEQSKYEKIQEINTNKTITCHSHHREEESLSLTLDQLDTLEQLYFETLICGNTEVRLVTTPVTRTSTFRWSFLHVSEMKKEKVKKKKKKNLQIDEGKRKPQTANLENQTTIKPTQTTNQKTRIILYYTSNHAMIP
jgi:hypothetical protein